MALWCSVVNKTAPLYSKLYNHFTKTIHHHHHSPLVWRHGVVVITIAQLTSFNKVWNKVLCRFKSCLRHVKYLEWWRSPIMVPVRNRAKHLLAVNYTTKTIHHHHLHQHSISMPLVFHVIPGPDALCSWSLIKSPKLPPLSTSLKAIGYFLPCILSNCLCTFFKNALQLSIFCLNDLFISKIHLWVLCMIHDY